MSLVSTIVTLPLQQDQQEQQELDQGQEDIDYELKEQSYYNDETDEFVSKHEFGRVLAQKKLKKARRVRCNKFPRICLAKGSPGPYCCKNNCVNVLTDSHNCGSCGKKCKYNQICCNGKCINPSFNRRHCGGCNNRCKNGEFCAFGLCNYA